MAWDFEIDPYLGAGVGLTPGSSVHPARIKPAAARLSTIKVLNLVENIKPPMLNTF
jgi:hypothetical protein